MVAALPLSNMITGRYGPAPAWRDLWSALLGALLVSLMSTVLGWILIPADRDDD